MLLTTRYIQFYLISMIFTGQLSAACLFSSYFQSSTSRIYYFPFLILCLIKFPEYFILAYAVITGAHFFPYTWFYKEKAYGFFAGIISLGALIIGLMVSPNQIYYIPIFTSICLGALGIVFFISSRRRK